MDLAELVEISRFIGQPEQDCVILGEGNTSARAGEGEFFVKASGTQLAEASESTFVRLRQAALIEALDGPDLIDEEVNALLKRQVLNGATLAPSTEAFMHAYLLSIPGVEAVIHTHPTALLPILCLENCSEIARQRLFPDEIVCCGPIACHVPYGDPGLALARAIRGSVQAYIQEEGDWPKTIWIQNHGLICLGKTGKEALTATRMQVKAARIWSDLLNKGQPISTLLPEQVARIHHRPDEHYRQRLLWGAPGVRCG